MMTDIPRSHPSENVMMISHHFPHLQTLFGLHPRLSWEKTRGKFSRQHARTPGGVLEVYMTGGCDVFFWVENLHARYFFGSRDLSRIFLGLKKYAYFFGSYLRANFSFRVFVAISGSEKYSFELLFSDVCSRKTVLFNIKKTIQRTFVILFTFPVFSMTHYNDVHQCLSCHFSCSPGAVHHRGSSLLARVSPFALERA